MALFGQVGRLEWDHCLPVGAMVGVMALGLWAILKVKRWREEDAEVSAASPDEQIDHYQELVEEGLLDPEELDRIKARLEAQASPQPLNTDATIRLPNQPPDPTTSEK